MANTNSTWNDVGSPPTLKPTNVNDTINVSGVHASIARVRASVLGNPHDVSKSYSIQAGFAVKSVRITRTA